MELKLGKLPDRKPVKITITVSAELGRKLRVYAELYNELYQIENDSETVPDLIPYVLDIFLEADRNFAKAFRERELGACSGAQ